jgi:type I restriction-modification system DNA methylase subunit
MAKVYDEILQSNPIEDSNSGEGKSQLHSLNVFLSRLLFCFFAEDTEIFKKNLFTDSVSSHTKADGSDLADYLNKVFEILNTPPSQASLHNLGTMFESLNNNLRDSAPSYLANFPYVNGGLFGDKYYAPTFTATSRKLLIEVGGLQWKDINPDIFGSMIQAVVHPDQRSGMGMHYTSVQNIMKVIEPLFLNELREEFENNFDNPQKLKKLLERIYKFKIFDPACGSGNFLIIAYKELRKLEMDIFSQLQQSSKDWAGEKSTIMSGVRLSQFYGIELDDFAHEVAILSLWLAEHQMNVKFKQLFGSTPPSLPLREGGNIVCDNATRRNWEEVCPKTKDSEIFILGNPPYIGSSMQDNEQKKEMDFVFKGIDGYKNLDYIACWFLIGSKYIHNSNAQLAFVSTNSISQGEQVGLLWPHIFNQHVEISFAHQSFKWKNSARKNAGVICVVIGLSNLSNKPKIIFKDNIGQSVKNINPYLTSGASAVILRRSAPLGNLPQMLWGNKATDGGHLILTEVEKNNLLSKHPEAKEITKKYVGSQEFIKGIERWCLWIENRHKELAEGIPFIAERIRKVSEFRLESKAPSTRESAKKSHRFIQIQHEPAPALIIPSVSSELRRYIPIGYVGNDTVVNAQCYAIYNPEPYLFGVLSSWLHMIWVRAVAGRLKNDYRYSSAVCYFSFPFPDITEQQKNSIVIHVYNILEERERHSEKTMAQLYDPNKMPAALKEAHHNLDLAVERCYRSKPFTSDEERLEYLFKLYEEMIAKERVK